MILQSLIEGNSDPNGIDKRYHGYIDPIKVQHATQKLKEAAQQQMMRGRLNKIKSNVGDKMNNFRNNWNNMFSKKSLSQNDAHEDPTKEKEVRALLDFMTKALSEQNDIDKRK